jgi:prepilin-type N-terminal cleavage/methylation domain-containing protein
MKTPTTDSDVSGRPDNDRKTINKQAQRGTTLIELSVVIAVLLLLVGVLFIGITAWKNGANTAACIINLSSMQKAVRGQQNMTALNVGDPLPVAALTAAGFWAAQPQCPAGGIYSDAEVVPAAGAAYATCSIAGHAPSATSLANW